MYYKETGDGFVKVGAHLLPTPQKQNMDNSEENREIKSSRGKNSMEQVEAEVEENTLFARVELVKVKIVNGLRIKEDPNSTKRI